MKALLQSQLVFCSLMTESTFGQSHSLRLTQTVPFCGFYYLVFFI